MHKIDPMQILTEYLEGASIFDLAAKYEVHRTTIYRALRAKGAQLDWKPRKYEFRNRLIAEEYLAGIQPNVLAEKFGLSKIAIYKIIDLYKNSCIGG